MVAAPSNSLLRRASPQPSSDHTERSRFYELLWGAQPGWVEVCAGLNGGELESRGWLRPGESTAPDYIGLLAWTHQSYEADRASNRPHTRRYFQWPEESDRLDRYAQSLARHYGNVYTSLSTYPSTDAAKRRQNPQPSRIVLVEDGPTNPALPYSFEVLTSPYSRHAYYLLHEALEPQQLVALATGAAQRLSGADLSGCDRQQLVRLPTTVNSKRKANNFRVRLVDHQRVYTVSDLTSHFLPDQVPALSVGSEAMLAEPHTWAAVAQIDQPENLRPGGPLLQRNGALHRLKPNHFINRVITGQSQWADRPSGRGNSYSEWRYSLIKALWLHHYPQAEIRLLAEHLAGDDVQKRGTFHLRVDIDRIIGKLAHAHPRDEIACTPSYRLSTGQPGTHEPTPRARRGRPSSKDAQLDRLRDWLSEQTPNGWGLLLISITEAAQALHVSERSAQVYLRSLREAGEILTGQIDGNGSPYIILTNRFGGAENPVAATEATDTPIGQIDSELTQSAISSDQFGGADNSPCATDAEAIAMPAPPFIPEEGDRGAEKPAVPIAESSASRGAVDVGFSAVACVKSTLSPLMERTPPLCAPAAPGGQPGGVCAPGAGSVVSASASRPQRRGRQSQPKAVFGEPLPAPKRRPSGLPQTAWPTAEVTALEAELQRRRAMLRHMPRGPGRTSVERTVTQLSELIYTRREVGLVLMRYSAEPTAPPATGEPLLLQIGDAIGFASGATFAPPGSRDAVALEVLLRQPPESIVAASAGSLPCSQARLFGGDTVFTASAPLPDGWHLRRCDYRGNLSLHGVYWLAQGPGGMCSEPTPYRDQAERAAWLMGGVTDTVGCTY